MTSAICMAPDSFSRLQKNEALGAYSRAILVSVAGNRSRAGFCIDIAGIDYATAPTRWAFCPARSDPDFFIGNRIRTCISDDVKRGKGKAVLRKTTALYWAMPNYRNYWKEAGHLDEMNAAEAAIAA